MPGLEHVSSKSDAKKSYERLRRVSGKKVPGKHYIKSCMGSHPQLVYEHPGSTPAAFCWQHQLPQGAHVPGVNVTVKEIQAQLGQRTARARLVGNTGLVS